MPNNFSKDAEIAMRNSPALLAYLKNKFEVASLCSPSALTHPAASLIEHVATLLISVAQTGYTGTKKSLRFAVAESDSSNAFAYWSEPRNDWIVITSGLIETLWSESLRLDRLTHALEKDALGEFPMGATLRSAVSEADPSSSRFRELIFMSAVAFFVGHEIGHLVDGHAACYDGPGAYDKSNANDDDPLVTANGDQRRKQALELRADSFGVEYSLKFTLCTVLIPSFKPNLSPDAIASLQRQAAWIATLGMSLAMSTIRPVRVDITQHRKPEHPPSAFRALWLNSRANANMQEWLPKIDERTRQLIAQHALLQANALTVLPYDETQRCFDGCLSGEDLVRMLNQTGIRRLIFEDKATGEYVAALRALDAELHPLLIPRQRRVKWFRTEG
ncbi:M48 family metalloprotease [Burkholderia cenocepacia]|uniref:M48 family metalloprotease n=1 Tax=Burkholderia cenocepacia TaxID=95486 RepID=UPI00158C0669|nr:M48 family metalloprotease [Burkholderia cenocepacia]